MKTHEQLLAEGLARHEKARELIRSSEDTQEDPAKTFKALEALGLDLEQIFDLILPERQGRDLLVYRKPE